MQRHRHRRERDQRRAPVLQEEEHDQEHEHHRLAQRVHDFADRHLDEARGVVRHRVLEARREALRQPRHRARSRSSATSSALAPGCRKMPTSVAGLPLTRPMKS